MEQHPNLHLVEFDLTDMGSAIRLIAESEATEIYNLAAQSFVGVSFDQPYTTSQITGIGVLNLLESVRVLNPKIRFYQASTSEMFGKVRAMPQDELTDFHPRSPYGVAKLYAHWLTVNYRESFDIFGVSGILFNHESPLRGLEFVTRKITNAIARIKLGLQEVLELGNLDAKRDWGFAKEYVEGMWKMLQADRPDTYVLATGRTESVRNFVTIAARCVGMEIEWIGEGENEVGVELRSRRIIVRVNREYYRPAEVDVLVGCPRKAKRELGWEATSTLEELCGMMVASDLARSNALRK